MNIVILQRLVMSVCVQEIVLIRFMNLIALSIRSIWLRAFCRFLGAFFIKQDIAILLRLFLSLLLIHVIIQKLLIDLRGAEVKINAICMRIFQ
jgi:hypothetical protein